MADDSSRLGGSTSGDAVLADLGRVEAVVVEVLRAGGAPVLAVGVVPLPELSAVRLGLFGEAGTVAPPAWEGWLPQDAAADLLDRHPGLRRAAWDGGLVSAWSVAWTEDDGPLVLWNAAGGRLRVASGVVDLLDRGRWTVVPTGRVARVSLVALPGGLAAVRLHTVDGRSVGLPAGRGTAAALAAERVAAVLGVDWSGSRWEP